MKGSVVLSCLDSSPGELSFSAGAGGCQPELLRVLPQDTFQLCTGIEQSKPVAEKCIVPYMLRAILNAFQQGYVGRVAPVSYGDAVRHTTATQPGTPQLHQTAPCTLQRQDTPSPAVRTLSPLLCNLAADSSSSLKGTEPPDSAESSSPDKEALHEGACIVSNRGGSKSVNE